MLCKIKAKEVNRAIFVVSLVVYETFLPESVQYIVGLSEAEEQQHIGGNYRGASDGNQRIVPGCREAYWGKLEARDKVSITLWTGEGGCVTVSPILDYYQLHPL